MFLGGTIGAFIYNHKDCQVVIGRENVNLLTTVCQFFQKNVLFIKMSKWEILVVLVFLPRKLHANL